MTDSHHGQQGKKNSGSEPRERMVDGKNNGRERLLSRISVEHPWISEITSDLQDELSELLRTDSIEVTVSFQDMWCLEPRSYPLDFECSAVLLARGSQSVLKYHNILRLVEALESDLDGFKLLRLEPLLKECDPAAIPESSYRILFRMPKDTARVLRKRIDKKTVEKVQSAGDRMYMWDLIMQTGSGIAETEAEASRDLVCIANSGKRHDILQLCLLALVISKGKPINVLAILRATEAVPYLIEILEDRTDRPERVAAAWALGVIGDRKALPALIRDLQRAESPSSANCAIALGVLGDESAIPCLIDALNSKREEVVADAALALHRLTGHDFGDDYDKWKTWYERNKDR